MDLEKEISPFLNENCELAIRLVKNEFDEKKEILASLKKENDKNYRSFDIMEFCASNMAYLQISRGFLTSIKDFFPDELKDLINKFLGEITNLLEEKKKEFGFYDVRH